MSAEMWVLWVKTVTKNDSHATIGVVTGHHRNTIRNWINDPTPEAVFEIARAYRGDILEGLVAADLLTTDEASHMQSGSPFARTSSRALASELADRVDAATERLDGRDPLETPEPPEQE